MITLTPFSVNVLTKIDNLRAVGGADLPFNLDFYTEVQDLTRLLPALAVEQASTTGSSAKWESLNSAIIGLIEDFGLVGFETLAVEDRISMASLLAAIDRASGHALMGARATDETGRTVDGEASVWALAMGERWAGRMEVRDVQERWIERKEELDKVERKEWEDEARWAGALDGQPAATLVRRNDGGLQKMDVDVDGQDEDEGERELLAEQRRWEEDRRKGEGGGGGSEAGIRVMRKEMK